ncbi:MAG: alcohol dehydrogenase catalytic domain-containing protein [Phycisphaerae bacterium]
MRTTSWPLVRGLGRLTPRAWSAPLGGLGSASPTSTRRRCRPHWSASAPASAASAAGPGPHHAPQSPGHLQRFVSFPAVLGHENVGTIAELGSAVRDWTVGRRVCVDPALGCAARAIAPPCSPCVEGRPSACENIDRGALPAGMITGLNSATGGSWSAGFVAHASQLVAVPDDAPHESAVLVDPIACAAHAVLRRRPHAAERVLVVGSGVVAAGVVASLKALGDAADGRRSSAIRSRPSRCRAWGCSTPACIRGWSAGVRRYDDVANACNGRRVAGRFGNQALVGGFDVVYECAGGGASLRWPADPQPRHGRRRRHHADRPGRRHRALAQGAAGGRLQRSADRAARRPPTAHLPRAGLRMAALAGCASTAC